MDSELAEWINRDGIEKVKATLELRKQLRGFDVKENDPMELETFLQLQYLDAERNSRIYLKAPVARLERTMDKYSIGASDGQGYPISGDSLRYEAGLLQTNSNVKEGSPCL